MYIKRFISISILLLLIIITYCQSVSAQNVTAYLINYSKASPDTSMTYNFTNIKDTVIDLGFCIKHFNYPPKFPTNMNIHPPDSVKGSEYWTITDSYDSIGRLVSHFYYGSQVSGVFPRWYQLYYKDKLTERIDIINDSFDASGYKFYYNDFNITQIEFINKENISLNKLVIILK
jgi:hypothetical protein